MMEAIFLSAGVPDPKRGPEYAESAEPVAITAAVSAVVHVTLGRRLLVWGGHPAITPMVWAIADGLDADYGGWVRLYQSEYFGDDYPEDNERFHNITYVGAVNGSREQSLLAMRERMLSDYEFSNAVFIGGMAGVVQEYELLQRLQPKARSIPIISTGGAAIEIAERLGELPPDLRNDLDYVSLFHRHLGIPAKEKRYRHPSDQPPNLQDRLWKSGEGQGD